MNCDLVKRRLLSSEDPELDPPDIRAHLATCGYCREWRRHLLQVERNIPLLPVPASRGRARLLQRFLPPAAKPVPQGAVGPPPVPGASPPATVPLRRTLVLVRLGAAAAAVFLVVVLGSRMVSSRHRLPTETGPVAHAVPPAPADRLLAGLVRHDLRLAMAATPRERLAILADVADEILDPAGALTAETANSQLEALARLYERVVQEGILRQARTLPPAERRSILSPIAKRLASNAQHMDGLVQKVPGEQSRPLLSIASVAREGNRQLDSLVAEVRS
jgi:hypothetical protein